jgi:hypothetical protein
MFSDHSSNVQLSSFSIWGSLSSSETSGEATGVDWVVRESDQKSGIPSEIAGVILLKRRSNSRFQMSASIQVDVTGLSFLGALQRAQPPEEPILFNPALQPSGDLGSLEDLDPNNLGRFKLDQVGYNTLRGLNYLESRFELQNPESREYYDCDPSSGLSLPDGEDPLPATPAMGVPEAVAVNQNQVVQTVHVESPKLTTYYAEIWNTGIQSAALDSEIKGLIKVKSKTWDGFNSDLLRQFFPWFKVEPVSSNYYILC